MECTPEHASADRVILTIQEERWSRAGDCDTTRVTSNRSEHMMTQYVVWMDSNKAMLFNLTADGAKTHLESHGVDHHTPKKDQVTDAKQQHFYRDLAAALKDAGEILIMGPGQSKEHFKSHVESHHTADLAKRIKGIENSDHPTDNQILAAGRKFFA